MGRKRTHGPKEAESGHNGDCQSTAEKDIEAINEYEIKDPTCDEEETMACSVETLPLAAQVDHVSVHRLVRLPHSLS
jgi:hypothetical protein